MAKVIPLGELRDDLHDGSAAAPATHATRGSARIYDLAERRAANRIEEHATRELALRAQRLGALDGQTVQVCWEEPDAPGVPRYAVGFQYSHTDAELLLAFYTGGPDRIGPTLAIPLAGIRSVLQLTPESVRF